MKHKHMCLLNIRDVQAASELAAESTLTRLWNTLTPDVLTLQAAGMEPS